MTASLTTAEIRALSPPDARAAIRAGQWTDQTAGLAPGYVQANLAILPAADAADFERFCELNPKPCPLLDVTLPGSPVPARTAPDADLRTDLPGYRVFEHGELVAETDDIRSWWRDDLVAFLLGCSFTFEPALIEAGVPVRSIDRGTVVPMYRTNRMCEPVGRFQGPMVVSMRPIPADLVDLATKITGRFPAVHGAPVHAGDPAEIGIDDLSRPHWGDPPVAEPGDVPVFWACGVTPQAVALASKPDLMITHSPGHMFVTDLRVEDLEKDV
ncbi:putative hydro-lyase [soil metagenome]